MICSSLLNGKCNFVHGNCVKEFWWIIYKRKATILLPPSFAVGMPTNQIVISAIKQKGNTLQCLINVIYMNKSLPIYFPSNISYLRHNCTFGISSLPPEERGGNEIGLQKKDVFGPFD